MRNHPDNDNEHMEDGSSQGTAPGTGDPAEGTPAAPTPGGDQSGAPRP